MTDGVCVTPLGVEPKHADVLDRPPRNPGSGIIYQDIAISRLILGLYHGYWHSSDFRAATSVDWHPALLLSALWLLSNGSML